MTCNLVALQLKTMTFRWLQTREIPVAEDVAWHASSKSLSIVQIDQIIRGLQGQAGNDL